MTTLNMVQVTLTTSGDTYMQSCPDTPEMIRSCVEFLMGCAANADQSLRNITFDPHTLEVEDDATTDIN